MLRLFVRLFRVVQTYIYISLAWIIVVPLSSIIPKRQNSILFIGRDNGRLLDNLKHLFLYALNNNRDNGKKNNNYYFLTEDTSTYKYLNNLNLPVVHYPSISTILLLLRTNTVIVDNWMWISKFKYHLLIKAKKVQLWHGIPLKKIQLMNDENIKRLNSLRLNIYCKLIGLFPRYDFLISTSEYYTKHAFSKAFQAQKIINSGYPRNDCLFNSDNPSSKANTDLEVMNRVLESKQKGYKILIYTPTFRDTGGDAIQDKTLDLLKLSQFAKKHKLLFVFKFHPDPNYAYQFTDTDNILLYDSDCDIYPLLPNSDCLITDYSSIYFDYLLVDKPIIFFPYDEDKYTKYDRDFIFQYDDMTPGPKCYNQQELHNNILNMLLKDKDIYKEKRNDLCKLAFKFRDGNSSKRVWESIKQLSNT